MNGIILETAIRIDKESTHILDLYFIMLSISFQV